MTPDEAGRYLKAYKDGELSQEELLKQFQRAPFEELGFAKIDTHRALRKGFPEVVFGEGKTPGQIAAIVSKLSHQSHAVLVTRVNPQAADEVQALCPDLIYEEGAHCLMWKGPKQLVPKGRVCVVSAGTSDLAVAEEAALTATVMGHQVDRLYDVGVAGLHRLLASMDRLQSVEVIIVVAGMEGALPSVVAGLVSQPVIAVPTSVGYGASFAGVAALLGMLSSCGSGVTVVNIDNGFGAAYAASQILRMIHTEPKSS